jgi:type I restriction-modification system DNA methylase subunit
MEQNKTNWFSFLKSLEDITREGKSNFTGGEAFNEFVNLISLRFKQEYVKKYIKDLKKKDIDEDDIASEIDSDFIIENLYNKYCKVYEDCESKKEEYDRERKKKVKESEVTKQKEKVLKLSQELTELEKETETKSRELYSLLYDFDRIWEKTSDPKNPDHKIMKRRDKTLFKHCIMERMMYNDGMNNIVNFKEKHEKISNFSIDHRYDIVKLIIKIHKTFGSEKLTEMDYDAFGEGYEKYTADEVMKAKSWGQYFTRRDVIDIIIDEIKPQYNEKGADETCGTGGFLLGFLKHVKKNLEDDYNNNKITKSEYKERLKQFKRNIYGHEIVWKVFKPLILNLQCHDIFVADEDETHIKFDSCLSKENLQKGEVYDFMAGNPPFGLSIKWEEYFGDKLGKNKIKNSVALILQLYLYKLKQGGRLGLVIDRGILNNGTDGKKTWEKALREKMIYEGGLYKILLLPTGIFAHTNFATAVVFFKKGVKAKEIEFVEGYFKEEEKGKGVKKLHFKDGIKIDIKKIEKNGFSLKLDDYIEKPKENTEGWIKLGDIIKFDIGGTPSTKENSYWNGEYKWVSVKELNGNIIEDTEKKITKKGIENSSVKLIKQGSTMMSFKLSVGKIGFAGCDMYCNEAIMFFKHENENTHKFITYCLRLIPFDESLLNGGVGIGSMNKQTLSEIKIPNLSIEHQKKIVEFLDTLYEKYKIEDTVKYLSGANIFNLLINRQYNEFEQLLWYQEQIPRMMADLAQIPRMKNDYIRGLFNTVESKECKLGDVIKSISCGKCIPKEQLKKEVNNETIPYYGANGIIGYTEKEELYNGEYILCARNGSLGSLYHVNCKFYPSDHTFVMNFKNKIINKFGYLFLKYCIDWYGLNKHNAMPGISKATLENIKIPISSLEDQQKIIDEIEKIESEQSSYNKYAQILQEQINNMNTTIKNICTVQKQEKTKDKESKKSVSDSDSESESDEKPKAKKKDKVKNSKKKVESDSSSNNNSSSESEKEMVKKKEKVKHTKKKVVVSESSSSDSSDDSSNSSSSESEDEKSKNKNKGKSKK